MIPLTSPAPSAPTASRILIVDDSEDDAFLLAAHVRKLYPRASFERVDCAADMSRALAESDWDLVISDHSMPQFDSLAALDVLKVSRKDIPFIIYSGHLPQDQGIEAMHGGARDFVAKSAPEHLLPVIERELASARLRRAKELAERSVVQLANYDELTRLPNRGLFQELAQLRLMETGARAVEAAVLYVDLDRFMRINDSFGYPTGDALMGQVARRLEQALRPGDVLARLGQDEFGLFLDKIEGEQAADEFLQGVMRAFAPPFMQNEQEFYLTPSIGASLAPLHGTDPATLVRNAESAMFAAKKRGRNCYQLYRSDLSNLSVHRFRLENDLRHAVERGQLFLAYQPILELRARRVIAAEALVRWRHPELGLVPPDQFIPIADETGMILEVGDWVLRTACAQAREWQARGFTDLGVSVNFSPAQFKQARLLEAVESTLRETGLPSRLLTLEITESMAMQHAESTVQTLRDLKRMGVCIAIDDFGTGYSSLAYLKRFPIDVLKIDKSFVREISEGSDDGAIVHTIAALGRALKLTVLAEGVETADQCGFLTAQEVQRAQGYFFSKPVPAPDLLAYIERGPLACPPGPDAAAAAPAARTSHAA